LATGETLVNYIRRRLEVLTGTERVRVPKDHEDGQSNVILAVRGTYLLDDEGNVHESADTSGNRIVRSWPDGSTVQLTGTFTKSGAGAGTVTVTPAAGDECIIMIGKVTVGAVRAGGADSMTVAINDSTVTNLSQLALLDMNVNDVLNLPTAFADAAVALGADTGLPTQYQLMIDTNHALSFSLAGMANAEVFTVTMTFRSLTGTVPTAVGSGGTWA
jgi:hypothetical protein